MGCLPLTRVIDVAESGLDLVRLTVVISLRQNQTSWQACNKGTGLKLKLVGSYLIFLA